jgi:hypothetical protein
MCILPSSFSKEYSNIIAYFSVFVKSFLVLIYSAEVFFSIQEVRYVSKHLLFLVFSSFTFDVQECLL